MENPKRTFLNALVLFLLAGGISLAGHRSLQEQKPKVEKPLDSKFVQMAKIYERSQRAGRYASRLKAKYANDPKTLSASRKKYELAKDKFDSWLSALGLAIVHKQKKEIEGPQFKQLASEADKVAIDFEAYAEALTQIEEANPLTGESAMASRRSSASASVASIAENKSSARASRISGEPPPPPIPIVVEIIVGIAFEVYKQHQAIKQAERVQFVADMRQTVSWKEWGAIEGDSDTVSLPAPKATPMTSPTPRVAPSPTTSPSPKASPKPTPKP